MAHKLSNIHFPFHNIQQPHSFLIYSVCIIIIIIRLEIKRSSHRCTEIVQEQFTGIIWTGSNPVHDHSLHDASRDGISRVKLHVIDISSRHPRSSQQNNPPSPRHYPCVISVHSGGVEPVTACMSSQLTIDSVSRTTVTGNQDV